MKILISKLGVIVTDTVTELRGTMIVSTLDCASNKMYLFQPSAINPNTKVPVSPFWVTQERMAGREDYEVDLPIQILGSIVQDKITEFKGTAIVIEYHSNGCIHIEVKAKGVVESTGQSIDSCHFDLRRLVGEQITELNEDELEESKIKKPSPEHLLNLFKR